MDLKQRNLRFLGEDWNRVGTLMRKVLSSDIALLNQTNDNILSHNGKMLRPTLSLLMARACAPAANEASVKVAAAVELLHNATLLHDDVADASDKRRGVPTTSSILGDRASVLLGDYWLVRAMDLIFDTGAHSAELMRFFAKTLSDLAEGEMLQLQKAAVGDTSREDYLRIIYSKTASLFEAACVSGALSVDAPEELLAAARSYGVSVGLAFQIKDDILDYTATDALGKPVGVDLREQKITLPLIGALLQVSDERNRLVRRMVCEIGEHPGYAALIRDFVLEEGGIQYAETVLDEYVAKAREAARQLPAGEAASLLGEFAGFIAEREV